MSFFRVHEPGAAWAEGRLWPRQQARTVSDASASRIELLVLIYGQLGVVWVNLGSFGGLRSELNQQGGVL